MSKARQLADLGNVYDDGALSNRNMVTNGAMQVWQRAVSQTTSGYGSVDRWQVVNITSASRQTDAPSGFQYSILLETSTATFPFIAQKWESANVQHLSGADITLTFWAKSVSGTASIFAEHLTADAVDDYSAVTGRGAKAWTNPSTSWTKYTHTFTNVNSAVLNGLEIRIGMQNQSSGSIQITGVQLEQGDTATPFEHRSYSDELARCQRYYEVISRATSNNTYGTLWSQPLNTFSNCWTNVEYKVSKRAVPSFGLFSGASWSGSTPDSFPTVDALVLHAAGYYYILGRSPGDPQAYLDAEL